jgi:hypothetical protein
MMKDPKIEAFSREFFGQWLRYRDYLAKDTIPANTFPGYDASCASDVRGTDAADHAFDSAGRAGR